jgi:hypothetical protein
MKDTPLSAGQTSPGWVQCIRYFLPARRARAARPIILTAL